MQKLQYQARCHCGQISFAFQSEKITTGVRCNCSICVRKGAIMSSTYIPAKDFQRHEELSLLGVYRWNDRIVGHLFCKKCGIYPYHGDEHYGYRVNLGCVEGLDPLALNITVLDGRSMPIAVEPGPHP